MATSLQWPLRLFVTAVYFLFFLKFNGHVSTIVSLFKATSLQRLPFYSDYLSTTATSLQRPPLYNGHLSTAATTLEWPLRLFVTAFFLFSFSEI